MIRITFLNVGQGDSIIIEYITESERKIAIVDCCLYNRSNPVLEYIIDNSYEHIDYLIMSHPHFDHFSGFHQLLQYCNENGISIKYFLHTFLNFPAYLTSIKGSPKEGNELIALFDYIKDNRTDMGFKLGAIHADMPNNSFNIGGCKITILSPGADEYDRFINSANYNTVETAETIQNLPNWLSTVLFLKLESGFVLFTSDCEKSALHRIDKNEREILNDKLLLAQCPHHGAQKNHNGTFWKKLQRVDDTPIVFSVGNNTYKHPAISVVEYFKKANYKLYATNKVGGLSGDIDLEMKIAFDVFSTLIPDKYEPDLSGNKIFEFVTTSNPIGS